MGKKKNQKNQTQLPFVSLCTPTFNRRPFISTMIECIANQDYPRDRMEWVIVDDGTDKIGDLLQNLTNVPKIHYYTINQKMTLGAKRNFTHSKCNGSILVYIDDDDYYPPERVSHAVNTLVNNKNVLCAGSSEIYVYFKHIQQMYQGGPYGPNHATAGTFAFRKELLQQTRYNENASLAEEREFLKNYTIPFVQLDPLKTILVFSHIQNTFDKRRLLEDKNDKFKPSPKTVDMFIRNTTKEQSIKDFFLQKIDDMLEKYKPGDPIMKPDVLKQMKEIEKQREQMKANSMQITIQDGSGNQRPLSMAEIAELLKKQQAEIQFYKTSKNNPLQEVVDYQAKKIKVLESVIAKLKEERESIPAPPVPVEPTPVAPIQLVNPPTSYCKTIPEVMVEI
jgi:glycosyltransferase involved in cell wall biosynthesis